MKDARQSPPLSRRPVFQSAASAERAALLAAVAGLGAVWLLVDLTGWGAGFQFYLALLPPFLAARPHWPRPVRWIAIGAVALGALLLSGWSEARPAAWALPHGLQAWLMRVNLAGALLGLGIWAMAHASHEQARLRRTQTTDALTGLLNRRGWMDSATSLPGQTGDDAAPRRASVLLIDVDHLKAVNDRHGHEVGDQALVAVAAALRRGLRHGDVLARWGTDEFIALLPGSDASAARMVGERLRALVQATTPRAPGGGELLALSVSLGGCAIQAGEALDAAIARAEAALAGAKAAGRNRVLVTRD